MSKNTLMAAIIPLLLCRAVLAAENPVFSPGYDLRGNISRIEVPLPGPASPAAESAGLKEWTIMAYINGKNNLEKSALQDMNEMEMIGSSDKVNMVVEAGRMAGYVATDGDWRSTRRYLMLVDKDTGTIGSPVVEDIGRTDMGDYKNLAAFVKWAKARYPAKKYMLIVWDHGTGWDKGASPFFSKGISYDHETKNHITTPQLAQALKEMGGVDLYGSDACLMQMAEVMYEIKDQVPYVIGSEAPIRLDSYPYDRILGGLVKDPAMGPEQLGRLIVDCITGYYSQIGMPSTQSLVRSSAMPGLKTLTDNFAAAVMATHEKDPVRNAWSGAQCYSHDGLDLWDFTALIMEYSRNESVILAGKALQDYISGTLVLSNGTVTDTYAKSHGISIYMPGFYYKASYAGLAWSEDANWDDFIGWYLQGI